MATVYTAAADAIVSGGAVQITEPDDTDALTAASNNIPEEKLANIVKKLINQAPLFGIGPSVLNAHLTNGLLFETEAGGVGTAKMRWYSTTAGVRDFVVTVNARWDGALWNRDLAGNDAVLFRMTSIDPNNGRSQFSLLFFDASTAASWADNAWLAVKNTSQGVAFNDGHILTPASVALGLNAGVAAYAGFGGPGGITPGVWKDAFGTKHLEGSIVAAASSSYVAATLAGGYLSTSAKRIAFGNRSTAAANPAHVAVMENGDIQVDSVSNGAVVDLSGITFR